MMKKQILFVDDEENLLNGIRRLLRSKRDEWEFHFANNGVEAVEIVKRQAISVIVSDMRMPGMDGADVLEKVSELSPATIRFILSGQSSEESVIRAARYAHLYLPKPCEPKYLMEVLERACALHDLIENSEIQTLTTRLGALPSIPVLYGKLLKGVESEGASIQSVGKIIAADSGMCLKILKTINSAFFAMPKEVNTVEEAVSILGVDMVSKMVLMGEIFNQFDSDVLERFHLDEIWDHINRSSVIAKRIAENERLTQDDVNAASTGSLLQDVGKLVMANRAPELYQLAIDKEMTECVEIEQAEQMVFGSSSAEIGAYLLGLWGLPTLVVKGVAYHTKLCIDKANDDEARVAAVIHVAAALDREINMGVGCNTGIEFAALKTMGIEEGKILQWRALAKEVFSVDSN